MKPMLEMLPKYLAGAPSEIWVQRMQRTRCEPWSDLSVSGVWVDDCSCGYLFFVSFIELEGSTLLD